MKFTTSRFAAVCGLCAILAPFQLRACPPSEAASQPQAALPASNMTVVRDAETRQLRPATTQELSRMAKAAQVSSATGRHAEVLQASAALSAQSGVRSHPGGAHSARLPASRVSYSIATRQADGTIAGHCLEGDAGAHEALEAASAPKRTPMTSHKAMTE